MGMNGKINREGHEARKGFSGVSLRDDFIEEDGGYEDGAHEGVAVEEGAIDGGDVHLLRSAMLEDEDGKYQNHAGIVGDAEMAEGAEQDEEQPHGGVEPLGQYETPRDAKTDDEGVHALALVEVVILRGVNEVKAGNPEYHSEGEDEWRDVKPA